MDKKGRLKREKKGVSTKWKDEKLIVGGTGVSGSKGPIYIN